jgi:hypothetical protein
MTFAVPGNLLRRNTTLPKQIDLSAAATIANKGQRLSIGAEAWLTIAGRMNGQPFGPTACHWTSPDIAPKYKDDRLAVWRNLGIVHHLNGLGDCHSTGD